MYRPLTVNELMARNRYVNAFAKDIVKTMKGISPRLAIAVLEELRDECNALINEQIDADIPADEAEVYGV
jgi:hypothetical protein